MKKKLFIIAVFAFILSLFFSQKVTFGSTQIFVTRVSQRMVTSTTTRFIPPVPNNVSQGVETNAQGNMPTTSTFSILTAITDPTNDPGTFVNRIRRNSANGSSTCSIVATTTPCQDLTNVDQFSPGQTINFSTAISGSPTASSVVMMSGIFTPATADEQVLMINYSSVNTATGTTSVSSINGSATMDSSANAARQNQTVAATGTIKSLYVNLVSAPGGSSQRDFTLVKNGATTTLSCSIVGAANTCSDTTNVIDVSPGDLLRLNSAVSVANAAGTILRAGLVYTPSSTGQGIFIAADTSAVASSPWYFEINGAGTGSATNTLVRAYIPTSTTLQGLYAGLQVAPGGTTEKTFYVTLNGATTTLSCSISDGDTSCSNTTGTLAVTAGDYLSYAAVNTSGTPATSRMYASVGYTFASGAPVAGAANTSTRLVIQGIPLTIKGLFNLK